MKKYILSALATSMISAQAVIIRVDNNNFADSNLVTDNAGNLLTSAQGIVAVGHFGSLSSAEVTSLGTTTVSNLFASFNQVGSNVDFSGSTSGFFTGSIDADLEGNDSSAVGRGAYIVVGNNRADITQSTEVLVFKFQEDFAGAPTSGPTTVNLENGKGELLIGGYDNYGFDNDNSAATPDAPAFNLVAVPEPSSTALLGLGGLAFVLRRKR